MTSATPPTFPPVEIGKESRPPVVVLPDPVDLFARRSRRFRALARDHQLSPYLLFLADLVAAQDAIRADLPAAAVPDEAQVARAVSFGMPAIDRAQAAADPAIMVALHRLFDAATDIAMPDPARAALTRLRLSEITELRPMVAAVLDQAIPAETVAEHVFVGAAVQVHLARVAAALAGPPLVFIGDGLCPACGGAPASSSLVNWAEADRTRFALCGLCSTRWNVVRVKCLACSSTKGIHYRHVEGEAGMIKAECCDTCRSYVKILSEDEEAALEGIADDVASLGLDMLVREEGFRRAAFNIFLIGT
jgi:FdhE protein